MCIRDRDHVWPALQVPIFLEETVSMMLISAQYTKMALIAKHVYLAINLVPVSYTHLDVYKRQPLVI